MAEQEQNQITAQTGDVVPVLPLRDVVIFPHMVIPLFVGREKSIAALEEAMANDKQILLVAQKDASVDEPEAEGIHTVGTLSTILQLLKLPDGTVKVLVEGGKRSKVSEFRTENEHYVGRVELLAESAYEDKEMDALMRSVINQFEQYVKLSKKTPPEVLTSLSSIEDPARLADTISAHLSLKVEEKQEVLEMEDLRERLEHLYSLMESEIDLLQVEKRIRGRVKSQMEKSQREYYLNEQMKAIQKELGELEEGGNEVDELEEKVEQAGMPKEVKEKADKELKKLRMMSPMSAEATVVRNYIDWLVSVPWKKKSRLTRDLAKAQQVLDEDHYGLEKIKERILEYLAVQQRSKKLKGPILCLVGPPGVGKTSLGKSIARATNRKFIRMSLGGVRDEAEIRGHRRTYIGALPGKIVQNLAKTGTRNPLMLLDEVDKMGMDFRGDPASALLEVLDPEQNSHFQDHYLEAEVDLSQVMFLTTANSMNIPPALRDRMEIIHLPGYTEEEKLHIAEKYLLPKQKEANGVKEDELTVSRNAILDIIRRYTREAGVRNLEREMGTLCRKAAKELLTESKRKKVQVTHKNLDKYLGVPRYRYGQAEEENQVGAATGLAWTEVGGDILTIEATVVPGKGKLTITGQLGDVMQESIQAAMSVVRARSRWLGLEDDFYQKHDIHVHVPEGATPKDGPSAGIGMCTAIISSFTGIPVRADVGMTGELTLRGRVLPIGGLKEKLLAARRSGLKEVIIPRENEKDLTEIPANIKDPLQVHAVDTIDEVLRIALEYLPEPLPGTGPAAKGEERDTAQGRPTAH
ncbi:DNA-binding protein [Thiohalorhabdus denitrificans]|uniref:Lon protease n=1 Tax=Thiohalorhabdus denitrificans TaxID=381306 RepID=A0A0P9C394_9GAMM|nr:endopeptidase La [Thiohalorhabdus denitrificans]KPV39160.1 DNA-binding protein [Thiohalorhabdus denitrificans]SCX76092.1 ATP-dependent proteinase. Serine peptidase. MEROPS family S16 [Thiohalorhabdus denitrificans]